MRPLHGKERVCKESKSVLPAEEEGNGEEALLSPAKEGEERWKKNESTTSRVLFQ